MCTAMKFNHDNGAVLGRTMDLEGFVPYQILFQPRSYVCAQNLLGGNFLSKYAVLGVGFNQRDPLKDGVNEHGLMGIINDFNGFNRYTKEVQADKINVSSNHLLTYLLANYKSVAEIKENLDTIHVASHDVNHQKVISPDFHFILTDSSQECIVIEPIKGKLQLIDNPYGVMTNPPSLDKHIHKLHELIDLDHLEDFNSAKLLPGGYDPVSRFIKAYYLKEMSLTAHNSQEALSQFYSVAAALTLPIGFIPNQSHQSYTHTRYISAYDSYNCLLTIKDAMNPQVYQVSLNQFDYNGQRQSFNIPQQFQAQNILGGTSDD